MCRTGDRLKAGKAPDHRAFPLHTIKELATDRDRPPVGFQIET